MIKKRNLVKLAEAPLTNHRGSLLTPRFSRAFKYAAHLHRDQVRKGTAIPYVTHLMSVSALVLEHGGDEDQAVAALLHDAVEDQGGLATLSEIRKRFGPGVAQLVMSCTDAVGREGQPKPPWRERKLAYIEKLATLPPEAALIITCDKIHNLNCLILDLQREGPSTLSRFARPASLGWYYSAVTTALARHRGRVPVRRLEALVQQFTALTANLPLPSGDPCA